LGDALLRAFDDEDEDEDADDDVVVAEFERHRDGLLLFLRFLLLLLLVEVVESVFRFGEPIDVDGRVVVVVVTRFGMGDDEERGVFMSSALLSLLVSVFLALGILKVLALKVVPRPKLDARLGDCDTGTFVFAQFMLSKLLRFNEGFVNLFADLVDLLVTSLLDEVSLTDDEVSLLAFSTSTRFGVDCMDNRAKDEGEGVRVVKLALCS
jgi:hypothetical protein